MTSVASIQFTSSRKKILPSGPQLRGWITALARLAAATLLPALLLCGVVCAAEPVAAETLTVDMTFPRNPDLPEAGRFIPADTPLLLSIAHDNPGTLPAGCAVAVRVIGHDGTEFCRRAWPVPAGKGGPVRFERLFRIGGLPGSVKIRVQAGVTDPSGRVIPTASAATDGWQDIFDGYALHTGPAWSRGWYPQEPADHLLRGCTGRGIIHCARPVFPVVLRVKGSAPVKCFDDGRWTLALEVNRTAMHTQVVEQNTFETAVTIDPSMPMPDCRSPDRSWPVGEMELAIVSDQTFEPRVCEGVDDNRVLAFHVTQLEIGDWLPLEGFRGPREPDGCYWPAPDCSVLVPAPVPGTRLIVQGRRDVRCMEMPQTVTVTVNGQRIGQFPVSDEWFVVPVPAESIPAGAPGEPLRVGITASPVFFRTQCGSEDDPNPYGVGIDEIAVR